MSARLVRSAAGLLAVVTLAGCGVDLPFGSDDATTAAPTATLDVEQAGRTLTEADITATFGGEPPGWYVTDPDIPSRPEWARTDPEACLDVLRWGEPAEAVTRTRTARASRAWETGGRDTRTVLTLEVSSHDAKVGSAMLDTATSAVEGCSAFSLSGRDLDERVLAEPIEAPSLGEQTFGVRLRTFASIDGADYTIVTDVILVRVGHNLVLGYQESRDPDATRDVMEAEVSGYLDRLDG